jgi:pimeloyl-ACP methyl ester carboxylesterase
MHRTANILLVHGAFADGSSWSSVIKLLQADGHDVRAVQLPQISHAQNVSFTRRAIDALAEPVILVGHSSGGLVRSDVSHANLKVAGLVFVAAFATDEGETLASLSQQGPPLPSASHIRRDPEGFLFVDQTMFSKDFAADVDPADARALAAAQKPIHASILDTPAGPPGWREHPSWYQVSERDAMISADAERFFSKRINAVETLSLPSSHASLISYSHEVAALIERAGKCAWK